MKRNRGRVPAVPGEPSLEWGPSAIFALLSSMFLCRPTKNAIAQWRGLLGGDVPPFLADLRKTLNGIDLNSEIDIENILWDYTRLFIGPYRLPCPPWESVYTSPKRLMMQEAHDSVMSDYASVGLEIGDPNVMPDHIGIELNFMSVMLRKAESDSEDGRRYREIAERFSAEHMGRWVPKFADDMEAAADESLYKALARLTKNLVGAVGQKGTPSGPGGKAVNEGSAPEGVSRPPCLVPDMS